MRASAEFRAQLFLRLLQGRADGEFALRRMINDMVIAALGIVNLVFLQEQDVVFRFQADFRLPVLHPLERLVQLHSQPRQRHRLDQKADGVHLIAADGALAEARGENQDSVRVTPPQLLRRRKAVHARHVNVHQHNVRMLAPDEKRRPVRVEHQLRHASRFRQILRHQALHILARLQFIIHNGDGHRLPSDCLVILL